MAPNGRMPIAQVPKGEGVLVVCSYSHRTWAGRAVKTFGGTPEPQAKKRSISASLFCTLGLLLAFPVFSNERGDIQVAFVEYLARILLTTS